MFIKNMFINKWTKCTPMARVEMRRAFISLNIFAVILLLLYLTISVALIMNKQSIGAAPGSSGSHPVASGGHSSSTLSPESIAADMRSLDAYLKHMAATYGNTTDRNATQLISADKVYEMIAPEVIAKGRCSAGHGSDLLVLVMVLNRVDDFARRQTLRQTWAADLRSDNRSRVYFAVGLHSDPGVQRRLTAEDVEHRDIIQWPFYESYYNCTIKSLAILRWSAVNCPFVKFVLKADDDSLVRADKLLDFARTARADKIYGHLWTKPPVYRTGNKWSINANDYSDEFYPDYIGGPWLVPGSQTMALYRAAITRALPALPFEDAYITGVVAEKVGVGRRPMPGLLYLANCDINRLDLCSYREHSLFWQGINDTSMTTFYEQIRHFDPNQCRLWSFGRIYINLRFYWDIVFNNNVACFVV